MSFEDIVREGTRQSGSRHQEKKKPSNRIACADGFTMSVIAGDGCYCTPRPGWVREAPSTYDGPYTAVEVGYPSERPVPWDAWQEYCENPEAPTSTVYGYVPVQLVRDLIAAHGGEK